ncbi:MAG: hypothetical protein ACREV5_00610 [Steroidobacter sp.]
MARFSATTALALVISVLIGAPLVAAGGPSRTDYSLGDSVPLDESELRNITLQVMQKNPLLASSPGIKFASAQRSVRSTDIASIVYFPHAESAGIKQAFQVRCVRQAPNELWVCGDAAIRRYLQLDSQDFEVRVTADIGTEEALALIQATRGTMQSSVPDGSAIPETVIMILPDGSDYLVSYGSPKGQQELIVRAHLTNDGNPVKPEDWQTRMFEPKD